MKIFIAASWLKLGGGVTCSLLELLRLIDFKKYEITLMLMDLYEQVNPLIPKEIKLTVTKDQFQTANSLEILNNLLKFGKFITCISYVA